MAEEPCSLGDCLIVSEPDLDGARKLHSNRRPNQEIWVDPDEWAKFKAEVKAGKYDEPGEA